jgi:NTP pyrophosphatase (non-canonical NTP hydrolase)/GNAT superfamily N-acetyltransferase
MRPLQKLIEAELEAREFGFDWPNFQMIIDQAIDECREIQEVVDLNESRLRLQEEVGDLLHTAISMCNFAKINVEETLSATHRKFQNRMDYVRYFAKEQGYESLKNQPAELLLELWHKAKAAEYPHDFGDNIVLQTMTVDDIDLVVEKFANVNWHKQASTFEKYLIEQERNQRDIKIAFYKEHFAGYATLKWQSDYQYFAQNNIPEIKDLNVLPEFRRKNIATKLIREFEVQAYNKNYSNIGIGVGLYADYGMAQNLYIKMDYRPDGVG